MTIIKSLFIAVCVLLNLGSLAQTRSIANQITIGGSKSDKGVDMINLPDGKVVICASSFSDISGDKGEDSYGSIDYWVYQLDALGNLVWQITLGGLGPDIPLSMIQTKDGGYAIMGNSDSPISGNKTAASRGGYDAWVVKISSNGILQWQESFGGSGSDFGKNLMELPSGDLVLGITSYNNIDGNKTVASKGSSDYWVVFVDDQGTIKNQYVYGGIGTESLDALKALSNGNILISGSSSSNVSGDKKQNSFGGMDYWLIEIDVDGNVIRSGTFGGVNPDYCSSALQLSNNEILLFGKSKSPVSGNKTADSLGLYDYWVVSIDSNFNMNWDASYGGDQDDISARFGGIYQVHDNLRLLVGTSSSGISGNKTSDSYGLSDVWVVAINNLGEKQYEFVAGGVDSDGGDFITQGSGSSIYVLGSSKSDISGNKTENSKGSNDVWFLELDFNLKVENRVQQSDIKVFPVPVSTILKFSIPMNGGKSQICLMDALGKCVYEDSGFTEKEAQINVSHLPSGVYFLSVKSPKFQYTRTVIID